MPNIHDLTCLCGVVQERVLSLSNLVMLYVDGTPAGSVRVSSGAVFSRKQGLPYHALILSACY